MSSLSSRTVDHKSRRSRLVVRNGVVSSKTQPTASQAFLVTTTAWRNWSSWPSAFLASRTLTVPPLYSASRSGTCAPFVGAIQHSRKGCGTSSTTSRSRSRRLSRSCSRPDSRCTCASLVVECAATGMCRLPSVDRGRRTCPKRPSGGAPRSSQSQYSTAPETLMYQSVDDSGSIIRRPRQPALVVSRGADMSYPLRLEAFET